MSSSMITSMRARSKSTPQNRTVLINHCEVIVDGVAVVHPSKLPDNRIVTSKYTWLNFVPRNLLEQFRRIANFYFLFVAVIQCSTNSPVSPLTSLAPLVFVVVTTGIKQGWEDYQRHRTDNATNHLEVQVLRGTVLTKVKSQDINVGDVVKIMNNEEIPCDLVLISSHDSDGKCHVTTANLDGETNLKPKDCLAVTKRFRNPSDFANLNGLIECDTPNSDLYEYQGSMLLNEQSSSQKYSLGPSNLLVRGSRLRNTEFVYGAAVYTGQETKVALNSKVTSNKFSTIEKTVNLYLVAYLSLLLLASAICTALRVYYRNDRELGKPWYTDGLTTEVSMVQFLTEEFLAFFVIYNYVIPISLYVTLEMVKFFGSKTLVNDPKLIDQASGERPKCNSSDLNEELGQVEYLFSDKTGTLTENEMRFRSCSVESVIYEEVNGKLVTKSATGSTKDSEMTPEMGQFFLAIALCNTVQVNKPHNADAVRAADAGSECEYLADSPDEKALVEACQRFGVVLTKVADKICDIKMGSTLRKFKKLEVFDFDSTRKRMSVIVEDEEGKLFLVCKGAESELLSLINQGPVNETFQHIDDYARQGLRTLVITQKELSREEYATITADVKTASTTLVDRKNEVMKAYIKAEKRLKLLGATAVEDRLQDGVPETISDLKKAGIKIWVLTGDKLETAVSVAYSCNLLDGGMTQIILARQANADACGECINRYATILQESTRSNTHPGEEQRYAFIVDGRSLHFAMKHHKAKFADVCKKCTVVVCCRMSPLQKADVVSMVKESKDRPVTAAIGDGANDVSMIQEAHVGFGLMGKEGRQAVNGCDFGFAKFRFVRRILLVHGNLFYNRVSTLIHYFFYKNVIFVTPQFIYSFYNAFSSQTLYHGMLLMLYNMMFTASPILIYGIVERHISMDVLSNDPSLYKANSRNRNMSFWEFTKWFLKGVYHGMIVYFFFMFMWQNTSLASNGQNFGQFAFGCTIYQAVVITATLKLGIMTRFWTTYFGSAVLLSLLAVPTFCSIYTAFKWGILDDNLYGVYIPLLYSWPFWLSLILIPVVSLLPDAVYVILENTLERSRLSKFFDKRKAHVTPQPSVQARF